MAKLTKEEKALRSRRREALHFEELHRRDAERRRGWKENGTCLTWEEYNSGTPCRACGLPLKDGLGELPFPVHRTDEQQAEHDAAEADLMRRHPDCGSRGWSASDSRTLHCRNCCPPVPMSPLSPEVRDRVVAILKHAMNRDRSELDTWQLTLTCDHIVERSADPSTTFSSCSVVSCAECEQSRGVVTAVRLPPNALRHRCETQRLSLEIEQARNDLEKAQIKAAAASRKLERLQAELNELGPAPTES